MLGIAQLAAAIWLVTLWLVGAPTFVLWGLVLVSFLLAGLSWWRRRQRRT